MSKTYHGNSSTSGSSHPAQASGVGAHGIWYSPSHTIATHVTYTITSLTWIAVNIANPLPT